MTDVNIIRSLIKRKVLISDLEQEISDLKREEIESLIGAAQDALSAIKIKVKAKSQITKEFKSQLTKENRENLKAQVSTISKAIKHLESELTENELKLGEIIAQTQPEKTPTQFKMQRSEQKMEGEPEFAIMQSHDEWATEWKLFLNAFESHSTYHRPQWLRVLSDYSGFELFFFVLKIDNKIVAGVPMLFMQSYLFGKNMISLPYVNYGGVLAYSSELTFRLLKHIREWARSQNVDYFEFRTTIPGLNLPVKSEKCSMILSLPSTDAQLEDQLTAKVRAQYKKAAAYDPQISFGGLELLEDFYYVFSRNMRDLGTPVYSKSIFKKILQESETNSFLCIVKINNMPVSAAFLTGYRDMLEIPWASTLRAANKYDANMWMYRMILKEAINLGYRYFDFGRATKNSTTYAFKKQWGAKAIDHYWYYLLEANLIPQTNPNNPKYRFFIAVWKRLPIWLANMIGPYVVKNIP